MNDRELLKKIIEDNLTNKEKIRKNILNSSSESYDKEYHRKRKNNMKRNIGAIAGAACLTFVVLLNINTTFASAAAQIPLIGRVAKVFTFNSYESHSDSNKMSVVIPNIGNTENKEFENKINSIINEQIDSLSSDAMKEADEYKKNFLAMEGNTKEDFTPIQYKFNYEVKKSDDNILSFIITKTEIINDASYETFYMYNLNLKTGNNITLEDMLGNEYKTVINNEIDRKMNEIAKSEPNTYSYYKEFYKDKGVGINENQNFYINEEGNVVIVFYKYEIVPEYKGNMEFEIKVK